MSEEREDKILDAALGGRPERASAEEAREILRLKAAFLALGAEADPVPPPPELKERLMTQIQADVRRRRWTPLALAAAALVMVGGGVWLSLAPPNARVAALSGDVRLDGRPLALGDRLPAGASLETAPGAWARLALGKNAVVHLGENGRLFLDRLRGAMSLRLDVGSLVSKVRPETKFTVHSPLAAASVRGTTFFVQAGPGRDYICLCEGKLHVSSPAGERDLEAAHHAAVSVQEGRLADAGMEGHMDKDLETLSLP